MTAGTLLTLGYTETDAQARLDAFVARPLSFVVDIRLTPYSRYRPQWNRPALQKRYGRRYVHLRGLGNVNHQDRSQPIHLLDPEPQSSTWHSASCGVPPTCCCVPVRTTSAVTARSSLSRFCSLWASPIRHEQGWLRSACGTCLRSQRQGAAHENERERRERHVY